MPPSPPFVVPEPSFSRSSTSTSRSPRSQRKNAAAAPTTPPPTTTVDAVPGSSVSSPPRRNGACLQLRISARIAGDGGENQRPSVRGLRPPGQLFSRPAWRAGRDGTRGSREAGGGG